MSSKTSISHMSLAQITAFEPNKGSLEEWRDETILAASQESPGLFSLLVERYQEAFLRAALRVVHRKEDAEDIVQEAFVKIYRNAHRFTKQENAEFKSWAYKIVLNTSFTHYQKLKRRGMNEDADGDEALASIPTGEGAFLGLEAKMFIEGALRDLPEDLARVLKKHYIEDKAYEAIAKEEKSTVAAVKMKLFRARKAFKKLISSQEGSKEVDKVANSVN